MSDTRDDREESEKRPYYLQRYSTKGYRAHSKNNCYINPSNKWKQRWDFYIMFCMVAACILTPLQLAFVEEDTIEWIIMSAAIDVSFFIDIVLTFFSAYVEESNMQLETNKAVIAKKYLKFWFWMDLLSIIPFDLILQNIF